MVRGAGSGGVAGWLRDWGFLAWAKKIKELLIGPFRMCIKLDGHIGILSNDRGPDSLMKQPTHRTGPMELTTSLLGMNLLDDH